MSLSYISDSEVTIASNSIISLRVSVKNKLDCRAGDKIIFFEDTKTGDVIIKVVKKNDMEGYYQEKYKK